MGACAAEFGAITHGPPDLNASNSQVFQQPKSQEGKLPALGSRSSLREPFFMSKIQRAAPAGAWSPPGGTAQAAMPRQTRPVRQLF